MWCRPLSYTKLLFDKEGNEVLTVSLDNVTAPLSNADFHVNIVRSSAVGIDSRPAVNQIDGTPHPVRFSMMLCSTTVSLGIFATDFTLE